MENAIKVVVLMGLPGSGKSYFMEHYKENNPDACPVSISFDKYDMNQLNVKQLIKQRFENHNGCCPNMLILDGLYLTKAAVIKILSDVKHVFSEKFYSGHTVYAMRYIDIVYFNGNKEICIKNVVDPKNIDIINNTVLEVIDQSFIDELYEKFGISKHKINIINIDVKDYSGYNKFFSLICSQHGHCNYFMSDSWITAGHDCDCWGSEDEVIPEEPKRFDKFYELLEKICPSMSDEMIDYLFNECCQQTSEESDEDYYGSWIEYTSWICNMKKLYQLLIEKGFINE